MKRSKNTIRNYLKLMAVIPVAAVIITGFTSCRNQAGSGRSKNEASALTSDSSVVLGKPAPPDAPPAPPPPPPLPYNATNGDTVWFRVDEFPVYPGGTDALFNQISNTFKYPESARDKRIQGRVVVGFVVTTECTIANIKIVTGIDPACDAEAIRVVNSLQQFEKPARVKGRPVSYHYTLPVNFVLN